MGILLESPTHGIHRLPQPPGTRNSLVAGLGGVVGAGLILGTFYLERFRLPGRMIVHYSLNGTPDGWSTPWGFAFGGVGLELMTALLFSGILYGLGRSSLLEHRYGAVFRRPLLGTSLLVSLVGIPVSWVVAGLDAAGVWPPGAPGVVQVAVLSGVAVVVGVVCLFTISIRGGPPPSPSRLGGMAWDGVRFECPSCGATSPAPRYWMIMPRFGVGARLGGSSYYFRCPRCREWGWERRVY